MKEEFFDRLRERVKGYLEDGSGHCFNHVMRVYDMAVKISEGEDVDMDVVRAAALLHDVARSKQDGGNICHAEEGAKMAREILNEMDFPEDKIDRVAHAIEVHRHSKKFKAETYEAEVIQDADRLDGLGAVAITRPFERGGKRGRVSYGKSDRETTLEYIKWRLLAVLPEMFNMPKAREIATERYEFTIGFINRFEKEIGGEL